MIKEFTGEISPNSKVYILKFSAPWCSQCKALATTIEAFAKDHPDIDIYDINVDEDIASDLTSLYNIRSLPTLIIVKDSEEFVTLRGAIPRAKLDEVFLQDA